MDFIFDEADAAEDDFKLRFSDDSDEESASPSSEDDDFITDEEIEAENEPSFYGSFDNREEFYQFKNQFKNPVEVSKRSEDEFYGEEICQRCTCQKKENMLPFICFKTKKRELLILKRANDVFQMRSKIIFFILLFTELCIKRQKEKP